MKHLPVSWCIPPLTYCWGNMNPQWFLWYLNMFSSILTVMFGPPVLAKVLIKQDIRKYFMQIFAKIKCWKIGVHFIKAYYHINNKWCYFFTLTINKEKKISTIGQLWTFRPGSLSEGYIMRIGRLMQRVQPQQMDDLGVQNFRVNIFRKEFI